MTRDWRPSAPLSNLHRRAEILAQIRDFFKNRGVLEVQTPLLSKSTVTDPHLDSFRTFYHTEDSTTHSLYLQTSPEFAMKRLLAAGSGPIYQITPAFRNQGEQGRWHNPEFTLLEWYRPDFNLQTLMDEVDALLQSVLDCPFATRMTYTELFQHFVDLNPHQATLTQIKHTLSKLAIHLEPLHWLNDRDTGLQLIVDHLTQHHVDATRPLFLYDFPASQAALARIRQGIPSVAERCEVYYQGLELANGFHELTDPKEQHKRFLTDLATRKQRGLPQIPVDEALIQALEHGLPDCSGIALGLDRLIALATHSESISEVFSFPITRA